jgi:hypothetical protein
MNPTKAELQVMVEQAQADLAQAQERLQVLEAQVRQLTAANQQQAGQAAALQTENQALRSQIQALQAAPPGLLMGADQDAKPAGVLQSENQVLQEQLALLQAQLDEQGQAPAMDAGQVGGLVNELYRELAGSFPGLSVRGAQLTMKFRAQPLAGKGGFLLASAGEAAPDASEVQEITLHYDRRSPSEP